MVRFAHLADVHLGGWRQEEMQSLNFKSFQKAVQTCIEKKVEFTLIAGDLFDSAYPSIDILKETFAEFKKLYEAKIPVFLIAGSHDYSVSGKTFLDVLEKAGFCKNVYNEEIIGEEIILNPTIHKGVAIYGYPGKKSGLEVKDIKKLKLNDSPGMFKILMLHTTLDKVRGVLPIECVEFEELPKADYYALGHIHVNFSYKNLVYPGPIFPNNFSELETLEKGTFFIVDTEDEQPLEKIDISLKKIEAFHAVVKDTKVATENIVYELSQRDLKDKILLLRLEGELEDQKISDINFQKIEEAAYKQGAYFVLRNTHDLKTKELDFDLEVRADKSEDIENETIKKYSETNHSKFNHLIPKIMGSFGIEKQEGETVEVFNKKVLDIGKKVLEFED
jgi:DNA repair protein SbcD/Mre11